jgi:hypothetical protein
MANLPEYKLKIFTDALQAHFDQQANSDFAENDLAIYDDDWLLHDESGDDIAADLIKVQHEIRKGRRKLAQQKWRQTEAGKAATKAWNESKQAKEAKKAWLHSETGRAAKKRERKTWKKTETGKLSTNATKRKQP